LFSSSSRILIVVVARRRLYNESMPPPKRSRYNLVLAISSRSTSYASLSVFGRVNDDQCRRNGTSLSSCHFLLYWAAGGVGRSRSGILSFCHREQATLFFLTRHPKSLESPQNSEGGAQKGDARSAIVNRLNDARCKDIPS